MEVTYDVTHISCLTSIIQIHPNEMSPNLAFNVTMALDIHGRILLKWAP
jgi:hypothetical protein